METRDAESRLNTGLRDAKVIDSRRHVVEDDRSTTVGRYTHRYQFGPGRHRTGHEQKGDDGADKRPEERAVGGFLEYRGVLFWISGGFRSVGV